MNTDLTDTYNGWRGQNFSHDWKFNLGDVADAQQVDFDDSTWRSLDLPHDWSIELPFNPSSAAGSGGGYLDGGVGWYRKTFTVPAAYAGKKIFVGFDGAYMNSQVWVNGRFLGLRPYGYVWFAYDLTPHLNFGGTNVIAVRLNHNQPGSRWYSGSGLYRHVWLTVLDPVHVDTCGMFVTTPSVSAQAATINVHTRILSQSDTVQEVSLNLTLLDADGKAVASAPAPATAIRANESSTFQQDLEIRTPQQWSVDTPYLYTAQAQVVVEGKGVVDTYQTTFGIRTFRMDADTGFWLNDANLKLNGVCLHHDLGALGAAVNRRAIEHQLKMMKEMGCNAIRTAHNPPEPMLLDLCDRLGLLVIDEAFDAWKEAKVANDYNLYFDEWAEADLKAMVRRDRNHPCIIMYSIGNEIHDVMSDEGVARAQNLIRWVREEDATRLVTHGSNFNEWGTAVADLLDAVGYNYNTHLYDLQHEQFPHWKIYASETSSAVRSRGVYKLPTDQNILVGDDHQCSSYDNSVVEWGTSAEQSWKNVNLRPFVAGEFIWTGFDYIGEPTPYEWPSKSSYFGIVDTCGFPKDIYFFYKSRWTTQPMVHLLPHWNWSVGQIIPVWAYTNCDSVELFLNGASLGSRTFQPDGPLHLEWQVPFQPGTLSAKAWKDGTVVATADVRTAGMPARTAVTADRRTIQADGRDLAFVTVDIVDRKEVLVPTANHSVSFSISGPGAIVGVDNGNAASTESYKGTVRQAFNGKCLAIVQSTSEAGVIALTAQANGLSSGSIQITTQT